MSAPDELERRISTRQAATFLGVTRRHVELLIRAGELEAWDVRGAGAKRARYAVSVSSLRVWLAARHRPKRTEGTDAAPAVLAAGPRARVTGE